MKARNRHESSFRTFSFQAADVLNILQDSKAATETASLNMIDDGANECAWEDQAFSSWFREEPSPASSPSSASSPSLPSSSRSSPSSPEIDHEVRDCERFHAVDEFSCEDDEIVMVFDPELCLFTYAPGCPESEVFLARHRTVENTMTLGARDYCVPIQMSARGAWMDTLSFVRNRFRDGGFYYRFNSKELRSVLDEGKRFLDIDVFADRVEYFGTPGYTPPGRR